MQNGTFADTSAACGPNRNWIFAIIACCLLTSIVGCDIPERAPLKRPEKSETSLAKLARQTQDVGSQQSDGATAPFRGNWERWEAVFVADQHIGYKHTTAVSLGKGDEQRVKYDLDQCLLVARGAGAMLTERRMEQSAELPNGQLVSFETELAVGPVVTTCTGINEVDQLSVVKTRGITRTTKQLPWQPEYRGLVSVVQSIYRKPMVAGEQRTWKSVLPLQQKIVTFQLHCVGLAAVTLLDGKEHALLEISVGIDLGDDQRSYSIVWANEQGEVLRTFDPVMQMTAYRTDKTTAMNDIFSRESSIGLASIEAKGKMERPGEVKRVGFKLVPINRHAASSNSAAVRKRVTPQPGQFVRQMDDGSVLVLVSRLSESARNGFESWDRSVDESDSLANAFVDANHALIKRFAQAASVSKDLGKRDVAVELTRSTQRLTTIHSKAAMFPVASEVARDAQGDSTAAAVMLAALLRAKGIPARLAFGFRHEGGESNRMVYHAWTLAHVDGDWLSLDATTGDIAAADRITLATSPLDDRNISTVLAPLLEFLGTHEVTIVESALRY